MGNCESIPFNGCERGNKYFKFSILIYQNRATVNIFLASMPNRNFPS